MPPSVFPILRLAALALATALSGCERPSAPPPGPDPPETRVERSAPRAKAAQPVPEPVELAFEGQVAERLDAGGYTYLHIAAAGAEPRWVVTMGRARAAQPGASVLVSAFGKKSDFESRRLQRRFPELYFGLVRPAESPADPDLMAQGASR